ncbi:MAG: putative glycoside hydrolase [Halobacteriota archaeon]
MKHANRNATKALFILAVSLLVAGFVFSPAGAASTSSSDGSSAQRLIYASAPHTYVDFKSSWERDTAAHLAKYDVVALSYTETSQHIQAIKALNPNVVVLAYFNPLFGGSEGTPHPEWYLRDASGSTHPSGYNEPLMDLTNPGWRAICVQICQNALSKGFDGLVLDNGLTSPNVLWPGSWSGSDSQWQSSTISLYKSIKQAAGSKIVIYNGAYSIPGYVDALDGYMDEGFPFYKGWDHSIGFALDASTKGKIALFYAQGNVFDRYFCYCSALLTDGYFFYAPTGTTRFNDYGIQLGTALNKAEKMSDGTWQRDYQYGTVVVNPSAKMAHIDLKIGQNVQSATTLTRTPTATSTPKATTTVKQATSTPKATTTVKQATSTPKATTTVKQAASTPSLTKTAPAKAKATLTPRLVAASKQASGQSSNSSSNSLIAAKNASEMPDNASVLGMSVPAAQTSSVASLPPQPVLEFSLLGLGIPALVAGSIYLLIRRL